MAMWIQKTPHPGAKIKEIFKIESLYPPHQQVRYRSRALGDEIKILAWSLTHAILTAKQFIFLYLQLFRFPFQFLRPCFIGIYERRKGTIAKNSHLVLQKEQSKQHYKV